MDGACRRDVSRTDGVRLARRRDRGGGIRTPSPLIWNQMLCRLELLPLVARASMKPSRARDCKHLFPRVPWPAPTPAPSCSSVPSGPRKFCRVRGVPLQSRRSRNSPSPRVARAPVHARWVDRGIVRGCQVWHGHVRRESMRVSSLIRREVGPLMRACPPVSCSVTTGDDGLVRRTSSAWRTRPTRVRNGFDARLDTAVRRVRALGFDLGVAGSGDMAAPRPLNSLTSIPMTHLTERHFSAALLARRATPPHEDP